MTLRVAAAAAVPWLVLPLAFPSGAEVLPYVTLRAGARGRRVRWKGREYESA